MGRYQRGVHFGATWKELRKEAHILLQIFALINKTNIQRFKWSKEKITLMINNGKWYDFSKNFHSLAPSLNLSPVQPSAFENQCKFWDFSSM
jgi:hypothetical protein